MLYLAHSTFVKQISSVLKHFIKTSMNGDMANQVDKKATINLNE